jgi:hypothetical protein
VREWDYIGVIKGGCLPGTSEDELHFISVNGHYVGIVSYREGTNTGKQRMNTINAMQQ